MHSFPTIDEFTEMGGDIVDTLPPGILKHLHGGILVRPEKRVTRGLLTLGQYNYQPYSLGRYIIIYYGSFQEMYRKKTPAVVKKRLRETICHELLHHWESLSGTNTLAKEEARRWQEYFS